MNPVTYARMTANLSKLELGRQLQISRTFIIRAEQGCYVDPGKKLIKFSCNRLNVDRADLMERYESFQFQKRTDEVSNRSLLKLRCPFPVEKSFKNSDQGVTTDTSGLIEIYNHEVFKKWREDYYNTIIGFSGSMCVHPSSVEQYENGKLQSMPNQLRDALESMNLIDHSFDPETRWFYAAA